MSSPPSDPPSDSEDDFQIEKHLWGYLEPFSDNPKVVRIDFWRMTPECILGRDPMVAQVILPGAHISGKHATLSWNRRTGRSAVMTVEDHSSNGTWVNGQPVGHGQTCALRDHDEISFGAPVAVSEEDGLFDYRYEFRAVAGKPPLLFDHLYKKGALLGQGGYGSVHSAVEKKTGRVVAIKTIAYSLDALNTVHAMQQTFAEIIALQHIQHPHVIQLLGAHHSHSGPIIHLVLEIMPDNLFDYMNVEIHSRALWPTGPVHRGLPERICREIMYQLCHAMSHMHALGITHRDLKPENILLDTKNGAPFIKVADFGLADIQMNLNHQMPMTTLCGSTIYVAPEVADPTQPGYDHYADSFSAGVIMFTMLLLTSPWAQERISPGAPPLPDMRWRWLKRDIVTFEGYDLLAHLVEPNPARRLSLTGALSHTWLRNHQSMHPGVDLSNSMQ
ncbi:kinase-like domain-containing protein [Mycena vulgaris]|nr:kinase-like domain-containing protein [Mycena vulgaris]